MTFGLLLFIVVICLDVVWLVGFHVVYTAKSIGKEVVGRPDVLTLLLPELRDLKANCKAHPLLIRQL